MYVNTGELISALEQAMPIATKPQIIRYLLNRIELPCSGVNIKRFESGAYVLIQGKAATKLTDLLDKIPGAKKELIFTTKPMPESMIASERNNGVEVTTYEQWAKNWAESKKAAKPKEEKKDKIVEILSEIATLQNALCLKIDNLSRLVMKSNEKLDELCGAWKDGGGANADN